MRKVIRTTISPSANTVLTRLQALLDANSSPAQFADTLWKRKANSGPRRTAFEEIRKSLEKMARGRKRCMYCEDNLATDIDHFRPKALYPARAFKWENYLLACSHCNSNEKRSQFPLDARSDPLLLDPSIDDPYLHLVLVPETGWLGPTTPRGTSTEQVFGLNRREELTTGRADTWAHLERIVAEVGRATTPTVTNQLIGQAKRLSFQSVVHYFVRDGLSANPSFVRPELAKVLKARPELWSWAG